MDFSCLRAYYVLGSYFTRYFKDKVSRDFVKKINFKCNGIYFHGIDKFKGVLECPN